jgi:hypothetical protein
MGVVFLLMLAFLPLLQYSKPVRVSKLPAEGEKAMLHSEADHDWPDAVEHEAYDERDLVLR